MKTMRVIGIDPGIANVGVAILEMNDKKIKHVWSGLIKTWNTDRYEVRLDQIQTDLWKIIEQHFAYKSVPGYAAIEKVFVRMAALTKLTEARGAILAELGHYEIECHDYTASKVKKAITGNGTANKDMVQDIIRVNLKLKDGDIDPNVSDAMALAYSLCLDLQRKKDA
jgi:crossover junction endodeoxyribonuclease RuvC